MTRGSLPRYTKPHHDWPIDRVARWKRRLITIPAVFVAAGVVWTLSPGLVVVALIADLAGGFRRRRWLRVLGFVMGFLLVEVLTVLSAFALWIYSGCGIFLHHDWARRPHRFIQALWPRSVLWLITFFLSTEIRIDGVHLLSPGPVITMARHVSMADAVVPAAVVGWYNKMHLRFVMKDDLVWIPSIDIFGHRMPSYFVNRTPRNRDHELQPIRNLARGIDQHTAGGIFPEGTFRTPERFERSIARIRRNDPERAARISGLAHLLPPRHGGTLALLEGAPDADVVFIGHTGFEALHTLGHIVANIPLNHPVDVKVWRIPRHEVPVDEPARIAWLDEQWLAMDTWITETTRARVDRTAVLAP